MPRETLKMLHDNGLRLLLVGYESGNQQILHNIKKGMRVEVAEKFTQDCHDLGVKIHGTFILGLPGESKETIQQTIEFARRINPHTIQVSLAAPYPGTFLFDQAVKEGWLDAATYGPAARKGWLGLIGYLDADANLREVCIGTGAKNERAHYLTRPRIAGDFHGQAPVLWCASALLR